MKNSRSILQNLIIITLLITSQISGDSKDKAYKGAELFGLTSQEIKFGRIEVRMMAARGSGILSTCFTWKEKSEQANIFWEEADIEIFGKNNAETWQSNIIYGFNPIKTSEEVHDANLSLADDYHTYALEWTPNYISWSLDGTEVRRVTGQPATFLLSSAGIRFNIWASTSIAWAGAWDDNVLPQYQFVNWVKYYKYEDGNFILDWTDDFDSFDSDKWGKANWTFDGNRVDFDPANIVFKDGAMVLCLTKAGETGFTGTVPKDTTNVTSINPIRKDIPHNYVLKQNYPNPFNPTTKIKYTLMKSALTQILIYDHLGRKIKTLVEEHKSEGNHEIEFNAEDLSTGIYFYRMISGDYSETKKMLLVK